VVSTYDVRTLVARKAGLNKKVALLADDDALAQMLRGNGHTVLANPEEAQALESFDAELVVAFDGFLTDAKALALVANVAPRAELLLCIHNAASATSLLSALCGREPSRKERSSSTLPELTQWLAQHGYSIHSQEPVVMPHQPLALSADTEAQLRQLFEQLNPQSAADRYVIHAKRQIAHVPEIEAKLVSLVVADSADESALVGTLLSLSRQRLKPFEMVVVSNRDLDDLWRPLKGRAHISLHQVEQKNSPSITKRESPAALWNSGLAQARGQYVSLLEAGTLCEPNHFANLKAALESSTRAWSVAHHEGLLGELLDSTAASSANWMVDVSLIGNFSFSMADSDQAEAMLFLRLHALFAPVFVGGGANLPKPPAPAQKTLLDVLTARPLQALRPVAWQLLKPSLETAVLDTLGLKMPRLVPAAKRGFSLAQRVERAFRDARAQAMSERNKKPE
jgi:hypothetical protein